MANQYFQFKQFTINQEHCAMKVSTDGVLLGSWTHVGNASHILDIGTGTGLLALMLAQRSHAKIEAIDIDEPAFIQASENIQQSPWNGRMKAIHSSLQDFKGQKIFDLIVSNPPFFSNSLKSMDVKRNLARHCDSLTTEDLISGVDRLLSDSGRFNVILPFEKCNDFNAEACMVELYCNRKLMVFPSDNKSANRILMEFSRIRTRCLDEELVIRSTDGNYTSAFKKLTSDYYL